jgi:hypothetical protein
MRKIQKNKEIEKKNNIPLTLDWKVKLKTNKTLIKRLRKKNIKLKTNKTLM